MPTSNIKIQSNTTTNKSSTNTPLPYIEANLLNYLKSVFPDRVPDASMDDRAIWVEVGKVAAVRHLEDIYKQQNETE